MADLDWLVARPLAHRGLHDEQNGIVENTVSAFAAAIAARYGIECDLQISGDGEAMVSHDETLDRLTEGTGRLDAMTAAELRLVPFRATQDRMMTLGELCDFVAGRATLLIELKRPRVDDRRLAARTAKVLTGYGGQAAAMSVEPTQIVELRGIAPRLPRRVAAARRAGGAKARLGSCLGRAQALHDRGGAGNGGGSAIRRLFREGPAGTAPQACTRSFRPAAARVDSAQRR